MALCNVESIILLFICLILFLSVKCYALLHFGPHIVKVYFQEFMFSCYYEAILFIMRSVSNVLRLWKLLILVRFLYCHSSCFVFTLVVFRQFCRLFGWA
jgi:hypothetical protein